MDALEQKRIFELSLSIARQVLPFLGKKGIPATPENYMIFYLYFEGDMHMVRKVVDGQLNSGDPWTVDTTREIFEQLFSSEANVNFWRQNERLINQVKDTTQHILARSDETARLADQTSKNFHDTMQQASGLGGAAAIGDWMRKALSDIQLMGQASSNLSGDLRQKSGELERAVQTLDKLEVLAMTDELTQVANRRAWESRMRVEFNRYMRYERPCSLIMLDIDDFKGINDRFGHRVGDEALIQVANLTRDRLRTIDFMARYGGEEFTCLLPETNLDGAYMVAERLRVGLAERQLVINNKTRARITASLGVACFKKSDETPQDALERADKSMYLAKKLGKNLVCGERELKQQTAS